MRTIVIGVSALLLSGCAGIPPAVTIATTAIDGVSWAASGKTVTDHVISEVADADCRIIGLIEDGQICQERPAYEPARVATLQPLPATGTRLAARRDSAGGDPMVLPSGLEYLAAALEDQGLATAPEGPRAPMHAAAFAPVRAGRGFTGRRAPRDALARHAYLAAGIPAPRQSNGRRP